MSGRKYQDLLSKTQDYGADPESDYGPDWEGWPIGAFSSYDAYAKALCDYISGRNIETRRQQLLYVDMAITLDVLSLKSTTKRGPKKSTIIKLRGEPLVVFSQAILTALTVKDPDDRSFDGIHLTIRSTEMADAVDPLLGDDKNQQLLNSWKQVCFHAGGVIEYISETDFSADAQDIHISYEPTGFFAPCNAQTHIQSGLVGFASGAKKLDKITFDINRMQDEQFNGLRFQFEPDGGTCKPD